MGRIGEADFFNALMKEQMKHGRFSKSEVIAIKILSEYFYSDDLRRLVPAKIARDLKIDSIDVAYAVDVFLRWNMIAPVEDEKGSILYRQKNPRAANG